MFKKIVLLFIIAISFLCAISVEQEYNQMSNEQKQILIESYEFGKAFNLGYSLAAIAWQESSCGKYMINLQDPSAGVYHNNIVSVLNRHGIKDTKWNRNKMAQKLIDNIEFGAAEALAELEFWQTIHGENNWLLIWQSYNGGFAYMNNFNKSYKSSYEYSIKIQEKISFLKIMKINVSF